MSSKLLFHHSVRSFLVSDSTAPSTVSPGGFPANSAGVAIGEYRESTKGRQVNNASGYAPPSSARRRCKPWSTTAASAAGSRQIIILTTNSILPTDDLIASMQSSYRPSLDEAYLHPFPPSSNTRSPVYPRQVQQKMRPTRDFQDPAGGDIHLSATAHRLPDTGPASGGNSSSATWTASSGELGFLSDTDAVEERSQFVQEYNRLATKVGRLSSGRVCRSCG